MPPIFSIDMSPGEASLEAAELNKYLLAKSFFDCKEFDRCAAVFLPDTTLAGVLSIRPDDGSPLMAHRKAMPSAMSVDEPLPTISQRSLFLALHARVLSGEKAKDEESEMVMGPQDLGYIVNKQLLFVSRYLEKWFAEHRNEDGEISGTQGFLEYL